MGIKKWLNNRKEEQKSIKEKQEKCTHDLHDAHIKVEYSNHSLIGMFAGPTKIVCDTNGKVCSKCDKFIGLEPNFD